MLILGIDDAGRGPIMGPMILAGVLIKKEIEKAFKSKGVDDSKKLAHSKRIELSGIIEEVAEDFHVIAVSPETIDSAVESKTNNLNTLEAMNMAEIINTINSKKRHNEKIKVIIDCPSVNIPAWQITLTKFIAHTDNLDIICEHKADANHPAVSAASILAKVRREEEMENIKDKYGTTGSGYPSDPYTIDFLKKNGKKYKDAGIFRKSWATWKELFPEKNQSSLGDFK